MASKWLMIFATFTKPGIIDYVFLVDDDDHRTRLIK